MLLKRSLCARASKIAMEISREGKRPFAFTAWVSSDAEQTLYSAGRVSIPTDAFAPATYVLRAWFGREGCIGVGCSIIGAAAAPVHIHILSPDKLTFWLADELNVFVAGDDRPIVLAHQTKGALKAAEGALEVRLDEELWTRVLTRVVIFPARELREGAHRLKVMNGSNVLVDHRFWVLASQTLNWKRTVSWADDITRKAGDAVEVLYHERLALAPGLPPSVGQATERLFGSANGHTGAPRFMPADARFEPKTTNVYKIVQRDGTAWTRTCSSAACRLICGQQRETDEQACSLRWTTCVGCHEAYVVKLQRPACVSLSCSSE